MEWDKALKCPKGAIVTCENGHSIYEMTRDCFSHTRQLASQFKSINQNIGDPISGTKINEKCPDCGAAFTRQQFSGVRQFHFEERGWL